MNTHEWHDVPFVWPLVLNLVAPQKIDMAVFFVSPAKHSDT